jgi:hypothetical protein
MLGASFVKTGRAGVGRQRVEQENRVSFVLVKEAVRLVRHGDGTQFLAGLQDKLVRRVGEREVFSLGCADAWLLDSGTQ